MHYGYLDGLNVSLLGVEKVYEMFDWANTSSKGMILFIDKSEVFLKRVESLDKSDILNAFIKRTYKANKNLMVILSSNLISDLDENVIDILEILIEFNNPHLIERQKSIRLYFEKYILKKILQKKGGLKDDKFDYDKICFRIAELTDGFTEREIRSLTLNLILEILSEGDLKEESIIKVVEKIKKQID